MDGNSRTNSYQNLLSSHIMAQMNQILGRNNTASSAASSSSNSPTSTTSPRPTVTTLPVARIDSPQPDNRVNLARVMYKFSDFISHLHDHFQATLSHGDECDSAVVVPRSRQISTEFKLWIGKTRRAAIQALYIRARTQVAIQLPGLVARKSKVLGEYPSHFEEYFGLFCSNIATAAGVEHSVVHDLAFAMGFGQDLEMGGSWEHVDDNVEERDNEAGALEMAILQMFAFPNAYWAFCLVKAGPTVLIKIE